MAKYPALKLTLKSNSKVLDLGFGDGRNTAFLIEQGYEVYGIEITKEIVDLTAKRLANLGLSATLKIGRNRDIPFEDDFSMLYWVAMFHIIVTGLITFRSI